MMDSTTAKRRIEDASDDDKNLNLRGVYRTGEGDDGILYYLVIATKEYEGDEMLKIRYFALHPDEPEKDTWMENGITTRASDELYKGILTSVKFALDDANDDALINKSISDSLP